MRLLLIAACVTLAPSLAEGAIISYSWSGTVTPLSAMGDPWNLGGVKPFTLIASINDSQPDQNNTISVAEFSVVVLNLTVGGIAATPIQNGRLAFFDNIAASLDLIVLQNAQLQLNGNTISFGTHAALSDFTTFAFSDHLAAAPIFSPREDGHGAVFSDFYNASTGSTVTGAAVSSATPEPVSLAMWGAGTLGLGLVARRRKTRE